MNDKSRLRLRKPNKDFKGYRQTGGRQNEFYELIITGLKQSNGDTTVISCGDIDLQLSKDDMTSLLTENSWLSTDLVGKPIIVITEKKGLASKAKPFTNKAVIGCTTLNNDGTFGETFLNRGNSKHDNDKGIQIDGPTEIIDTEDTFIDRV